MTKKIKKYEEEIKSSLREQKIAWFNQDFYAKKSDEEELKWWFYTQEQSESRIKKQIMDLIPEKKQEKISILLTSLTRTTQTKMEYKAKWQSAKKEREEFAKKEPADE